MEISYQLYCSRNWSLDEALPMLQAAGYTEVEGYGGLFGDVAALKVGLNKHGLAMTSSHMGLADIAADPAAAVQLAKSLGIKKVFIPFVAPDDRPATAQGWRDFGARLADLGAPFVAAGLGFGWHNHAFECEAVEGEMPLDLIAEAGIAIELDLGWVARAGHDPAAWIDKYGTQISAVHVKDIAPEGAAEDEDGWADVGHGVLDWPAITAALARNKVTHLVIEHDNPSDHARFAQRSIASAKSF